MQDLPLFVVHFAFVFSIALLIPAGVVLIRELFRE